MSADKFVIASKHPAFGKMYLGRHRPVNDGSERTTTLRDRVLALTAKGLVEAEAEPVAVEAKGKRGKA